MSPSSLPLTGDIAGALARFFHGGSGPSHSSITRVLVGVRNLADPIRVDSTDPTDPMAQLAVVLLALFAQMERTYTAAHARAVAVAKGRSVGRPVQVTAKQLTHARLLRDAGASMAEITADTGLTRSTLYRHLPPRTAAADENAAEATTATGGDQP